MARGGYREGAGRPKSAWQTEGETITIRVPEELKDQILDYAKRLDKGEIDDDEQDEEEEEDAVERILNLIETLIKGLQKDGDNELDLESRDKAAGRRVLTALSQYLNDNGIE